MHSQSSYDRDEEGLRGQILKCIELTIMTPTQGFSGGEEQAQTQFRVDMEFDLAGRLKVKTYFNPDGSGGEYRFSYDPDGRLLRSVSEVREGPREELVHQYGEFGRLIGTISLPERRNVATYEYSETGRKRKVQISHPEDYKENVTFGGSPFSSVDHAPNFPNGGTTTTFYDDLDRPYEIEVREGAGELVLRVLRKYNEDGRITEEMQTSPDLAMTLPRELLERIQSQGDAAVLNLRSQLAMLTGGQSGHLRETYTYDDLGRRVGLHRFFLGREKLVETTYNQHGDPGSEITTVIKPGEGLPGDSGRRETIYSYRYDSLGNWIEKTTSYRESHNDELKTASKAFRTLIYR